MYNERERERERIFWILTCIITVLLFLYYYQLPFVADDWNIVNVWNFYQIFEGGDLAPGRHFSRLLNIVPGKIGSLLLLPLFRDHMASLKVSFAIMSSAITVGLWFVSLHYLESFRRSFSILMLALLSFSLRLLYFSPVYTLEIFGGLLSALLAWMPFLYYYKNGKLPSWIEQKPWRSYGLFFLIFYMGTQVTDQAYWLTGGMSAALIFLFLMGKLGFTSTPKPSPTLWVLAFMHFGLSITALLRNLIGTMQISARSIRFTSNPHVIYSRIFDGNGGALWQDISIVLGLCLIFYFAYLFIRTRDKKDFFYFSGFSVSVLVIIATSAIGTYMAQALWMLWVLESSLLFQLYNKRQKVVNFCLPMVFFALLIYDFQIFHKEKTPFIWENKDYFLRDTFISAEINGSPHVLLTQEDIKRYNISDTSTYYLDSVSRYMNYTRYTSKFLPIIVK